MLTINSIYVYIYRLVWCDSTFRSGPVAVSVPVSVSFRSFSSLFGMDPNIH